jgi:hypothetical protein
MSTALRCPSGSLGSPGVDQAPPLPVADVLAATLYAGVHPVVSAIGSVGERFPVRPVGASAANEQSAAR